jgi:Rrf2 family protein
MLALLRQTDGHRLTSYRLAEETRIPPEFLRKILSALSRARLVGAVRGPQGGVRLARKAEDISFLEILEAVEGPLALNECTRSPAGCQRTTHCPLHPVWKRIQDQLRHTLASISLASLRHGSAPR